MDKLITFLFSTSGLFCNVANGHGSYVGRLRNADYTYTVTGSSVASSVT